jgi:hypothetical protein
VYLTVITNIDKVTFTTTYPAGTLAVDNINIIPTPIPAAAWLLGSGLMGLLGLKRKKCNDGRIGEHIKCWQ